MRDRSISILDEYNGEIESVVDLHLFAGVEAFALKRGRLGRELLLEDDFRDFEYFVFLDEVIENHPEVFSEIVYKRIAV